MPKVPRAPEPLSLGGSESTPLTRESEQNLAALRRSLRRSDRFALYILVSDGPARAELMRRLHGWSGMDGVPAMHFFPAGRDAGTAVEQFLAWVSPSAPLAGAVFPDGDTLVAEGAPALALNVARDRLGEIIAGPLVIVLSAERAAELARMVPDLFDIRAATYTVELAPVLQADMHLESSKVGELAGPFLNALPSSSPAIEAQAGPAKLRELEASETPPPLAALADAWLRLAREREIRGDLPEAAMAAKEAARLARESQPHPYTRGEGMALRIIARTLQRAGQMGEAERTRQEALDLYRQAGDDAGRANVLYESSSALVMRGHTDEALRVLREDVLPVYEQLGDVRARAVTMGKIADVLQDRGQLDEVLRIRREEQLPVYEQLGDVRARAVTMGQIADVLQARGQLDEALRIRREEELPVYEQLGAQRDVLIGRTNMALTHLARGQPGDREAARDLLQLALEAAEILAIPEADRIREIQKKQGLLDP